MNNRESKNIRVLLAEDHPAVRQGLSLLLAQEGIGVCAEAASRSEALARVDDATPNIALVDLSLGDESGLDLIQELTGRNIPVLIYSMHEDPEVVEQCFKSGARGFVTKREDASALVRAIRDVQAGKLHISPRIAQSCALRMLNPAQTQGVCSLSVREKQILAMLGHGESNKGIASELGISIRTVESYFARLIDKIGVDGMRELRKHAIRSRK